MKYAFARAAGITPDNPRTTWGERRAELQYLREKQRPIVAERRKQEEERLEREANERFRANREQRAERLAAAPRSVPRFVGATECYWCGLEYVADTDGRWMRSREHLLPRAHGGGGGDNIVVAHRFCNTLRGVAMSWVPFAEHGRRGSLLRRHGDTLVFIMQVDLPQSTTGEPNPRPLVSATD